MKIFRAAVLHCLYYPEYSSDNTLFVSFRIKRKNGTYIKVLSKSTVLDMDTEGRIRHSLVKFTDISFIDKTDFINWDFKAGKLDREEFKSQIYGSVHDNLFTKRETEVISLIEKKLSSEEIACNLSISKHTVATHRKNIFKKSECHHPAELINFCRMRGVL
jgi:DNA-binding CsgD family transcriptional regulator